MQVKYLIEQRLEVDKELIQAKVELRKLKELAEAAQLKFALQAVVCDKLRKQAFDLFLKERGL